MYIKSKKIYTEEKVVDGYIKIVDGKIEDILESSVIVDGKIIDYGDKIVLPGFIDIHVHGWGRGSFCYKGDIDSLRLMSEDLVKVGVTSFLPTTGTMPKNHLEKNLKNYKKYKENWRKGRGAMAIGVHMEGPYINSTYKGMQLEDSIRKPSIEEFDYFNDLSGKEVKHITLAPEVEGAIPLIRHLKDSRVSVSAGHTSATFEKVREGIEAGLNNFTHTYSGMKGFHHRELGVVGAAFYFKDVYAEVAKQTGITIKPEAFDILYRLKGDERLILTSDTLGIGGFPNGYKFYHYLRKETFEVEGEFLKVRSDSGEEKKVKISRYKDVKNLELDYLSSCKNIVDRLEGKLMSLTKIASLNPARLIGVDDVKGSIKKGKDGDIIVVDENLNLVDVYCFGVKQYTKEDN